MTDLSAIVPALSAALKKRDYKTLTPVQSAVLAPELRDADLLVSAQTGSGKTVAFGLAVAPTLLGEAERFDKASSPIALAIAPTRELAMQVQRELAWLYEMTGAALATCVGGMDMRDERRTLSRGAHFVIGTPGRLKDHIERGSLDLSQIKAIVLDEADEMLDMGFRDDLEFILSKAPQERRTLMFSATVPRPIANLAKNYQRNAVRVTTQAEAEQHVDIDYRAMVVAANDRENAIVNVLRFFEAKNAMVFCGTREMVNHMTSRFNNRGFSVVALSGELNQSQRTHALQAMRDGRARVCVATDVAARGIDLPDLELVIHADLPKNSEILLHRSGRTGRAGRKGVSALIVPHRDRRKAERLLQGAKIQANWGAPPSADEVTARDDERILDNPSLNEAASEQELTLAMQLLEKFSAEQIAAALVRKYREGKSAPEDLLDVSSMDTGRGSDRAPRGKNDFENGVWFSLSVGRKHNAEPRWLLPAICKAGGITKKDIGAIRILESETHVEISPISADAFMTVIGPKRKLEKNISIKKMDGAPEKPKWTPETNLAGKRDHSKKPRRQFDKDTGEKPVKEFERKKRAGSNTKAGYGKKADAFTQPETTTEKKPFKKKAWAVKPKSDKPDSKKSTKPKAASAKSVGKFAGKPGTNKGGKPGSSPLKRKKPKA